MQAMSKKIGKTDEATEQINIRVSSALLERLDRLGTPFGISRSHQIRQAIVEYVQREEARQPQVVDHRKKP